MNQANTSVIEYSIRWPSESNGQKWEARYNQAAEGVMAHSGVHPFRIEAVKAALNDDAAMSRLNDREKIIARLMRTGTKFEALLLALTEGQVGIDNPDSFMRGLYDDLSRVLFLLKSANNSQNARSGALVPGGVLAGPTEQGELDALEEVLTTAHNRFKMSPALWAFSPNTPKEWEIKGADGPSIQNAPGAVKDPDQ